MGEEKTLNAFFLAAVTDSRLTSANYTCSGTASIGCKVGRSKCQVRRKKVYSVFAAHSSLFTVHCWRAGDITKGAPDALAKRESEGENVSNTRK